MKKKKWDAIKMLFIDKDIPVRRLLVTIILRSKKYKNHYYLGPFISDNEGILEVTKENLEEGIKQAQSDFIMDYSGGLAECEEVELVIEEMAELNKMAKSLLDWHPEKAKELQSLIQICVNGHYNERHIKLGLDFKDVIRIEMP